MAEHFVTALVGAAAAVPIALRWLRVSQREHYLPGSVIRFYQRWVEAEPMQFVAFTAIAAISRRAWVALVMAALFPLQLSPKGRTTPLAWTGRLKRLLGIAGSLWLVGVGFGLSIDSSWVVAIPTLLLPLLIDAASYVAAPFERILGNPWVAKARRRLNQVGPRVVAVTGSYGKTATKTYMAHLLSAGHRVIASPASFNNRLGLAKAINEHLADDTEFFVAEMGTYGKEEIADLCRWITPEVAVITAIGPVHLERMKTIEAIVEAKREILDRADVAVLNVDDRNLSRVADEEAGRRKVVRCSVTGQGDVVVAGDGVVVVGGVTIGKVDPDRVFLMDVACAIGAAVAVGLAVEDIAPRLDSFPNVEHRQDTLASDKGFSIIDDTFNANPVGAALALQRLSKAQGRKVVVTPGMVELGEKQDEENESFAKAAASLADQIVIVGRTNLGSLQIGAGQGQAAVMVVKSRPAAVDWVRNNLGPGDVVLYENDLPDHYP